MNDPGYSHILSFRRQVYVDPEDIIKLPETIQVNFDNTLYWIYISTDRPACFLCKEEGHLANYCQKGESSNQQTSKSSRQEMSTMETQEPETSRSPVTSKEKESSMGQKEVFKQPAASVYKRSLLTLTSSTSTNDTSGKGIRDNCLTETTKTVNLLDIINPPNKKPRKSKLLQDITKELELIKQHFTEIPHESSITYENLVEFFGKSYNKSNIRSLALEFTNDIPAFINMLKCMHDRMEQGKSRARISRIIQKLDNSKDNTPLREDFTSSDE